MQSPQDRSIEELKTQSELARANLTATVRELRGRFSDTTTEIQAMLSPSNVKEEVKSYARRTSDDVYQRIETRIRQNPLQAAASCADSGGGVFAAWIFVHELFGRAQLTNVADAQVVGTNGHK